MKRSDWLLPLAEFWGTALLIAVGCSFVVLDFAPHSPVVSWIPDPAVRRVLTGFLFGSTGATIALSKIGKISGAHINPVVTLAFWLQRRLSGAMAIRYVVAQFLGAALGALALGAWGPWARAEHYAATVPGPLGDSVAALGEMAATFCLIAGLFSILAHQRWRRFAPALFPALYAILVGLEAPWSGCSTNPARTFGPALVAHLWAGCWVYAVGPLLGTAFGLLLLNPVMRMLNWDIRVAKIYHFHHDPYQVFYPPHQVSEEPSL